MKKAAVVAALVAVLLTFGWASIDHCGDAGSSPGGLTAIARASGELRVGAAKAELDLPYPITVGGYGPWRHDASSSVAPLFARATAVEVGGQQFALVSLETLLVSDEVVSRLREGRASHVWVAATHTHTGPGQFDRRPAVEVAALGPFRAEVEAALISAGTKALDQALAALQPATVSHELGTQALTHARSGDEVDRRLRRVRFRAHPSGTELAQWVFLAAHPTLAARSTAVLDGDYPSQLAAQFEHVTGVTQVLQTAGGNASGNGSLGELTSGLASALEALPETAAENSVGFGFASSELSLGHPDAKRLGPGVFQPLIENALCRDAGLRAEISVLRLGEISLVAVPAEVTYASAKVIEQQSHATTVVSLTNGYAGYVEPERQVLDGTGESARHYFSAALLTQIAAAAQQASDAAGVK